MILNLFYHKPQSHMEIIRHTNHNSQLLIECIACFYFTIIIYPLNFNKKVTFFIQILKISKI